MASADFEGLGEFGILTGTAAPAPRYRAFYKDANGGQPPFLFEGIPAGITGELSVGA